MSDRCIWDRAWIGPCKESPVDERGMCAKHANEKCASCGQPAVRECGSTGIQFVCGSPLCATCQHGIPENGKEGWFLLGGGHVTKEVHEQQWKEYIARPAASP